VKPLIRTLLHVKAKREERWKLSRLLRGLGPAVVRNDAVCYERMLKWSSWRRRS